MVTIHDVAKHAGVSSATVSHVLNETRPVRSETAERVHDAIAQLQYRPNHAARMVRSRKSRMIGLLTPDNTNPYFAELAQAVEAESFRRNHVLMLCNSDSDPERERAYIDVLLSRQADGILLIPASEETAHLEALIASDTPVVLLDRVLDLPIDSVTSDGHGGGQLAAKSMIDQGHRRLAIIAGPERLSSSHDRVLGFLEAVAAAGMNPNEVSLYESNYRHEGGEHAAQKILAAGEMPDAVFAANDLMAIGCIRHFQRVGIRVPEDVSVVGFDDINLADAIHPALTTISQPTAKIGRTAVDLLLTVDRANNARPKHISLRTSLVQRDSSIPHRRSS